MAESKTFYEIGSKYKTKIHFIDAYRKKGILNRLYFTPLERYKLGIYLQRNDRKKTFS